MKLKLEGTSDGVKNLDITNEQGEALSDLSGYVESQNPEVLAAANAATVTIGCEQGDSPLSVTKNLKLHTPAGMSVNGFRATLLSSQ